MIDVLEDDKSVEIDKGPGFQDLQDLHDLNDCKTSFYLISRMMILKSVSGQVFLKGISLPT